MLLKKVLENCDFMCDEKIENIDIKGIKIDFDEIEKGDLFIDINRRHNLNQIFQKGASFVIRGGLKNEKSQPKVFSCIDVREVFSKVCKNFSNNACDKMKIVGITGTNGKSSTVKLVADVLKESGKEVGIVGTQGAFWKNQHKETGFTTPDPNILHSLFNTMQKQGVEYVVMEVSAHAIELHKCDDIKFEVMALTNITQDHLDFFENIENYEQAKFKIFNEKNTKQAVMCVDDERILKRLNSVDVPIITYGISNPSDTFAIDILSDMEGSSFVCNAVDDIFEIETSLVGEYNVLNCLCAINICKMLDVDLDHIINGIADSQAEVGRFNVINFNDFSTVIDFAHSPDGMENVLQTAKRLKKGRLIVLFGCGGNRDSSKRPIMGSIASVYADKIILTSDNPRFEEPMDIIDEIQKGVLLKDTIVEPDRKLAIFEALNLCKKDDVLLILGKGGETYQEIKGTKNPYSDFDEVYKFFRTNLKSIYKEFN